MEISGFKRVVAATLTAAAIVLTGPTAHADGQDIKVTNLFGASATKTANCVNTYAFEKIEKVYLASNQDFADALAGGVLAGEEKAALLFTDGETLSEETKAIIDGAEVVTVLGGENVISHELMESIGKGSRIAGYTRFDTAAEIAKHLGVGRNVLVVSGDTFADALSATSLAQLEDRNILLVRKDTVPMATREYLEKYGYGKEIIFAGGPNAISDEVKSEVYRLAGKDPESYKEASLYGTSRYDTSAAIAERFDGADTAILATGEGYMDALAAGGLAGKLSAPVILARDDKLDVVKTQLKNLKPKHIIVIGGSEIVDLVAIQDLVAELCGGKGADMTIVDANGEVVKVDRPVPVVEKKEEPKTSGGKGKDFSYKKAITMTATAYDDSYASNGKWGAVTALGTKLRPGVVAVDRRVIPLGTKLYIESMDSWPDYGFAVAEDTGGAIKGNKIDLFFKDTDTVWKFGRRKVKVYVLD